MPSKSKAKGNRFERTCVNTAKDLGLKSKRAWGSDGRSIGEEPEVDILVENYKIQCKTRKKIAKWIKPDEMVEVQLVKEDYGEAYIIQPYEQWLEMVKLLQVQNQHLKGKEM